MVSMSDCIWHHDKWFIQNIKIYPQLCELCLSTMGTNWCLSFLSSNICENISISWFILLIWFQNETRLIRICSITLSLNSISYTNGRRKTLVWSISVKIFCWMIKFEVRTRVVSLRKCHKTVLSFRYNGIQKLSLWMGVITLFWFKVHTWNHGLELVIVKY